MTSWPTRLLLFGATGDLASRSLFPALAALLEDGRLSADFSVLASGTSERSDEEFREHVREALADHDEFRPDTREQVAGMVRYRAADINDVASVREAVRAVPGEGPIVAYLALPPSTYAAAVDGLAASQLPEESRIVVEKPFGESFESARELNQRLYRCFPERAIFRVDHFLAKQTVHNVLGLRFANRLFEPLWSNQHIDRVEITFDETLALEGRATYYDGTGALVDMIQNHLLQLLCLVAMDPPATLEGEDLRDRKVTVLRSAEAIIDESVRAHYTAGRVRDREVPSYVDEEGVDPSLATETFASVTVVVDSWRWSGVPFVLRSGKALGEDRREVVVHFKDVPHVAFGEHRQPAHNLVRLQLGPDRLSIRLAMNADGDLFDLSAVELSTKLAPSELPAYANVLAHVFDGDPTFSIRGDEAEVAWRVVEPIRDAWRSGKVPMRHYAAGSDGPPG